MKYLIVTLTSLLLTGTTHAAGEQLATWQWFTEVPVPADASGRCDFVLTPAVYGGSRRELADLLLVDGAGKVVPFTLRVRQPNSVKVPIPQRSFSAGRAADASTELNVDLGSPDRDYTQLTVDRLPAGYHAEINVDGRDAVGGEWKEVGRGEVARLTIAGQPVDARTLTFPRSRFPLLRVRLKPGVAEPGELAVRLEQHTPTPGEMVTWPVKVNPRFDVNVDNTPGSAWFLDAEGDGVIPWEQLTLDVQEASFDRRFKLRVSNSHNQTKEDVIPQLGDLQRRPGEPVSPVRLERERTGNRLRLEVIDARNRPLTLTGATVTTAARQVIFDATGLASPVRLYFGNDHAMSARSDSVAGSPEPAPRRLVLGERQPNPEYRPEPIALTERWPWLVFVVLGVVGLALAGLLVPLARSAMQRADAETAPS